MAAVSPARPKVTIVGSGISGLAVAHALQAQADITLFEAGPYFGGHTHTVDITVATPQGQLTHGVDTGFLVFNERTYPKLIELFAELGVATARSDMSFSVKVPGAQPGRSLEWSGSSLNTVFAQRRNLLSWKFLEFHFKNRQPAVLQTIRGASHLKFNAASLVEYHRDYWDAAEELFEKLPLLGGLMRWLKKRAKT